VVFKPSASGGAAATLTLSASNAKPLSVPLSGIGQGGPGLNVSPTQLAFAAQALDQPSAPQTVTISNTGDTSAAGLKFANSGPFSLAQNTCGTSLAAGANCTTGVVFTPLTRGPLTGALTVTSSSLNTPARVALSGIGGLTGAVQITPSQVNFPTIGVGSTSSPATLTIANSSAAVELDGLKFSASPGFKLGNTTCKDSLAAGANCTLDVSFAPTTAGAQNGTLTLSSSQLAASATAPLSGTGFDFQAVASGASSQTVSSGVTASYSFNIIPSGGSSATFSLQCGTLPSYAVCEFSPSSLSVAGNATGTANLQITTTQASSAIVLPAALGGWKGLSLAMGILILPLALRRRRRMLLPLLALIVAVGFWGCSSSGGGGGSKPPPPLTHTTPAGTYPISVNVSAYGVQHTVTLTLVVD
jgi:hypothetical protein